MKICLMSKPTMHYNNRKTLYFYNNIIVKHSARTYSQINNLKITINLLLRRLLSMFPLWQNCLISLAVNIIY